MDEDIFLSKRILPHIAGISGKSKNVDIQKEIKDYPVVSTVFFGSSFCGECGASV